MILGSKRSALIYWKWCCCRVLFHFGPFSQYFEWFRASSVPDKIGWARISLFACVSMLLCFYMSGNSFKSGNTVNTEYLNRIPNPVSRICNWSKCTLHFSKVQHTQTWYCVTVFEFNSYIYIASIDFFQLVDFFQLTFFIGWNLENIKTFLKSES